MTAQVIRFSGWYTEELCKENLKLLFIFGDNVRGVGRGGQAIIRYEPNAFGIPTKRIGNNAPGSFFRTGNVKDIRAVKKALDEVENFLDYGSTIVLPVTEKGEISLGLERARLREVAPDIYDLICAAFAAFSAKYGGVDVQGGEGLHAIG